MSKRPDTPFFNVLLAMRDTFVTVLGLLLAFHYGYHTFGAVLAWTVVGVITSFNIVAIIVALKEVKR